MPTDYTNIIIAASAAIGTLITIIGTVISISVIIGKRFDRIEAEIKSQSDRLSRIEGMMHWVERVMFKETGSGRD